MTPTHRLTAPTRTQWSLRTRHLSHRRLSSTHAHLLTSLPSRRLPIIYDDLVPMPSYRLTQSLSAFLPHAWASTASTSRDSVPPTRPAPLPPAHHLVYFNPAIAADGLLKDGTDPLQSPGKPGGEAGEGEGRGIVMDRRRWACVERVRDVNIKGVEGDEKVYVGIERRFGAVKEDGREGEESLRRRLLTEVEEEWGDAELVERRNLVFMRERSAEEAAKAAAEARTKKALVAQNLPTVFHKLIPTPSLLFRYSALTFNAHAIHLDPQYCRAIEGHRNLLVHGPLSFTLLVTMLYQHLQHVSSSTSAPQPRIFSVQYRNLAPLYVNEPMKLCAREVPDALEPGRWELWVENPDGGMAVKGTAKTRV
ncbi:hypothetical protein BDY21DRAFT_386308 [Lineolata rhizophorae]|uniref:HotDog domain-containing protein n=1 Tax=Lineolata rhizophorae TaxID=578093 RepID=A0A6A6NZF9_9PEZI|nr:hypothetical protein BDY21DRAFT_386308 [Lineolata rhizophorae]